MGAYNIVNPAHLVSGQLEDVGDVLANLQAIQAILNGGLDNSNITAAAAIALSKLAGYPNDVTKVPRGDGTWGAAGALTLINSWTAPGGAYYDTNTILGGNIPATYKDLILTVSGNTSDAGDQPLYCQINNVNGVNYQWAGMQANGAAVSTTGGAASTDRISLGTISRTGANRCMFEVTFPDYSVNNLAGWAHSLWSYSTNFGSANAIVTGKNSGFLSSQAAITRILLFPGSGFFNASAVIKLYGRG